MKKSHVISQLAALEAESIHVMREVAAEFERPVLLFSGGKDSIVMLRLAEKAFHPARIPFPVMHVDTGHNFDEVMDYRDRRIAELGVNLVVASVQAAIDAGRVVEETGPRASRNKLQTVALLDAPQLRKRALPCALPVLFVGAVDAGHGDGEEAARPRQRLVERLQIAHGGVHVGEAVQIDERVSSARFDQRDFTSARFDHTFRHFTASGTRSFR